MNTCLCEHASHPLHPSQFNKPNADFPEYIMDDHFYMGVSAGSKNASWVGPICDDCANGHMSKYIVA